VELDFEEGGEEGGEGNGSEGGPDEIAGGGRGISQ